MTKEKALVRVCIYSTNGEIVYDKTKNRMVYNLDKNPWIHMPSDCDFPRERFLVLKKDDIWYTEVRPFKCQAIALG